MSETDQVRFLKSSMNGSGLATTLSCIGGALGSLTTGSSSSDSERVYSCGDPVGTNVSMGLGDLDLDREAARDAALDRDAACGDLDRDFDLDRDLDREAARDAAREGALGLATIPNAALAAARARIILALGDKDGDREAARDGALDGALDGAREGTLDGGFGDPTREAMRDPGTGAGLGCRDMGGGEGIGSMYLYTYIFSREEMWDSLPNEILFQIALQLPYSQLGTFAQLCKRHSPILTDDVYWLTKARHDLGHKSKHFRAIPEHPRLRYIELWTTLGPGCVRGSEEYIQAWKCTQRAIAQNKPGLVKYFLPMVAEKYIPRLAFIAAMSKDRPLTIQLAKGALSCCNAALRGAAYTGDEMLCRELVSMGAMDVSPAITAIVRMGGATLEEITDTRTLLGYLCDRYRGNTYHPIAVGAVWGGHWEILNSIFHFLDLEWLQYERNFTKRLAQSAPDELVQRFLESGGSPDWIMYGAAKAGNLERIRVAEQHGARDRAKACKGAVKHGHVELARLLFCEQVCVEDCYADALVRGYDMGFLGYHATHPICMHKAVKTGNLELVQWVVNRGNHHYQTGLEACCFYGYRDIAYYLLELAVNTGAFVKDSELRLLSANVEYRAVSELLASYQRGKHMDKPKEAQARAQDWVALRAILDEHQLFTS